MMDLRLFSGTKLRTKLDTINFHPFIIHIIIVALVRSCTNTLLFYLGKVKILIWIYQSLVFLEQHPFIVN